MGAWKGTPSTANLGFWAVIGHIFDAYRSKGKNVEF